MKHFLAAAVLGLASIGLSCNSVQTSACTPGQEGSCTADSGCAGHQVCKADGTFDTCMCNTGTTGSAMTTGATTGAGGTSTTSSGTKSSTSTGMTTSGATTASGSSSSGGPFSPANLPGLSLWLNDDVGVIEDQQNPGTLLKWKDQSGNNNTAAAQSVQNGWRFNIDPAAVNGHDAFACPGNGVELTVQDAASLQFGTGEYAIAMVFREGTLSTALQSMWEKNYVWFAYNSGTTLQFTQGPDTIAVAQLNTTKFHYAIVRGPNLRMLTDGGSTSGPTETTDVSEQGWPVYLCHNGAQNQEIAEVIAVKGALSDADASNLQGYFQMKFGL